MSPRTDLCDTCQHFRNGLQYNARKEEEAKDLLKNFKEHLVKAKLVLERNYYNKNTKLAEQQSGNIPKGEANSRMICTKFLKSDWFTPTFFPAFFVDFRDYYLQLKPRKHIRKRRLLFIFSSNQK